MSNPPHPELARASGPVEGCAPALRRRSAIGRRALLLAALAPALAGCGFHPLYAEREATMDPALAAVRVDPIPDRIGQQLEIALRDGFNPTGLGKPAQYSLRVTLLTTRREIGIRSDGTASRLQFDVYANYTLTRLSDGTVLLTAATRATTGVEIVTNTLYATVVAEDSSRERAVRDIGAEIQTRVALALKRQQA
jgi:LPS-assembly lipoprotein